MKKPYLKKVGSFSGIEVFYVSGYWIRRNLDKQFPNFGYNENFKFIPKNEFWIDYENGKKEARYWIDYFLAFRNFRGQGMRYKRAVNEANKVEKRERSKQRYLASVTEDGPTSKAYKKIHKKRILTKYTDKLHIWIVRGNHVRDLFDLDFNQGGHELVYHFIPKNEIWIDDDVYKKEIPYVLIHELHERWLMKKGWRYDSGANTQFMSKAEPHSAHFRAEALEFLARKYPKKTKRILLEQIKHNEKTASK